MKLLPALRRQSFGANSQLLGWSGPRLRVAGWGGNGKAGAVRAGRWFVHVADLRVWLAAKAETIRAAQLGVANRTPAAGAPDHEVEP